MEYPEKWETCLNVLKQEPDRILLIHKCPGPIRKKETWCWTRRNAKNASSGEVGEKRPKRKL